MNKQIDKSKAILILHVNIHQAKTSSHPESENNSMNFFLKPICLELDVDPVYNMKFLKRNFKKEVKIIKFTFDLNYIHY